MKKYRYTLSAGPLKHTGFTGVPDEATPEAAKLLIEQAALNGIELEWTEIEEHPLDTPRQQQIFNTVLNEDHNLTHLIPLIERYMDATNESEWFSYPDVTPNEGGCYYVAYRCDMYGEDTFDYTLATFSNGKWENGNGFVVKRVAYYHPLPPPPPKVFRDKLDDGFIQCPDNVHIDTEAAICAVSLVRSLGYHFVPNGPICWVKL